MKLVTLATLLFVLGSVTPALVSHAQKTDGLLTVSSVSSHPTARGTAITITADGSLSRAQTWQDKDGFHIVVPDAGLSDLVKSGDGVRVRRIGSSIEILLQTKAGTPVGIQAADNHLNLTVEGRLDSRGTDAQRSGDNEQPQESRSVETPLNYVGSSNSSSSTSSSSSATPLSASTSSVQPANSGNVASATEGARTAAQNPPASQAQGPVRDAGEPPSKVAKKSGEETVEDEGLLASVFSGTGVLVVFGLGIFGLLVVRRVRAHKVVAKGNKKENSYQSEIEDSEPQEAQDSRQSQDANTSLVRTNGGAPANNASRERRSVVRTPVATPASLFGAYRIDQEVGKLVIGQAHRMDVLSSRAPDDRRAIETSLIKTITSAESADDERRRARGALEEYGFVARQCAALLLASDAFERTSAARSLGEVGSAAGLPFLLEGLYDSESIVRNQAVVSIGELKLPSAIGALLDMARKHPDVPSSLVSRALSACSVEGLGFLDVIVTQTPQLSDGFDTGGMDITRLEPATSVEDLPESTVDEALATALSNIDSTDQSERAEAIKSLAQYQVRSSVAALISIARLDEESGLRSLAMSSLGAINHESVFPAILIGLADESREVRAAAARSLSRLSFDRADAYVRVIETSDEQTIREVAQACVKAGIVSQNIDRLASSDHRQAYEAFSLICLLAKAKMTEPVLAAILSHANLNVRLSAVHLLATTGQEEVVEQLRQLAVKEGVAEEVKTALLESLYKLEQTKPQAGGPIDDFVIRHSESEPPDQELLVQEPAQPDELRFSDEVEPQVDEVEP